MDVKSSFTIVAGIVWLSFVVIFLLAPADIADYTVIDVAFHKTEYRLVGKTAYNFNNVSDIAKIPKRIDGWVGVDFRYPKRVYEVLDADIVLSRAYTKDGRVIWVDIINSDKRKSFHDPRVCYGASWNIVNERVIAIEMKNSSVNFDRIYVNRLDLENKKNPNIKLVCLYWFMFRGGEGITMFRLSSPVVKDYNETCRVMEEFARDLLGLVYEEVKKPKTIAEAWIDRFGVLGYVGIIALLSPSLFAFSLANRRR